MKLLKTLFFIIFTLIPFASCSEEDDIRYSCNKTINTWVKSNLTEIHQMNRSEWLQANLSVGVAIYKAFTPQQRIQFWKEKFKEVKSMDWNEKELEHIQKVENFVNNHQDFFTYNGLSDEQLNQLDAFFYKWQKEAEQELGWDKKIGIAIAADGRRLKDTKGNVFQITESNSHSALPASVETNSSCHCNITYDFCLGEVCEDTHCEGDSWGCGWLLLSACNGRCVP